MRFLYFFKLRDSYLRFRKLIRIKLVVIGGVISMVEFNRGYTRKKTCFSFLGFK